MTDEVERVAIVALVYHELRRNWSCVGPRVDGSEIVYDFDNGREDMSLLTMWGSSAMSDLDWVIIRALERPDVLSSLLVEVEPWRAEAILHALAAGGGWEGVAIPAHLSLAAGERWMDVEETMERWRDLGITATRNDVDDTYLSAMEVGTGRSREDIEYDFIDEMTTKAEERGPAPTFDPRSVRPVWASLEPVRTWPNGARSGYALLRLDKICSATIQRSVPGLM